MSSEALEPKQYKSVRGRERLIDFVPERVVAPFPLRCGALLADYVIFIALPAAFMLISRAAGNDGAGLLNSGLNDIGWMMGLLIGFVSMVLLPIATGRTLGKMITGIRVVRSDGTEASIGRMLLRQCLAVILFPLTLGVSFFWSVISPRGRSLHDYFAGTMVIYADKRSR